MGKLGALIIAWTILKCAVYKRSSAGAQRVTCVACVRGMRALLDHENDSGVYKQIRFSVHAIRIKARMNNPRFVSVLTFGQRFYL